MTARASDRVKGWALCPVRLALICPPERVDMFAQAELIREHEESCEACRGDRLARDVMES